MKMPSVYRILIAPVIISAVIIYIAFYSIGVVEKHIAYDAAMSTLNTIRSNILEDSEEYEQVTGKLGAEYELKTRTLSVLISQLPKTFSEDMTSEELRIASGADEIMITDKNGLVIFSTTPDSSKKYADERFRDGLTQKNYCSTITDQNEDRCIFRVAVSRRNANGLIIAEFSDPALDKTFDYAGAEFALRRSVTIGSGVTALTDLRSGIFAAHSNPVLTGTECIIPAEKFRKDEGYFSFRYAQVPSFVFYRHFDDNTVLMSIVSKEYVYTKRTLVLVWLIVLDFVVMLTCFLSTRNYRKNNI